MNVKSLICPIEGNTGEVERALNEVEAFAKAEKLDNAKADRLRLVSEEVIGMASGILNVESGRFWIEREEEGYAVRFACEAEIGERAKAIFDSTSSNTAYKGMSGLFRKVYDKMQDAFSLTAGSMPESELVASGVYGSGLELVEPGAYEWTLERYDEKCELDNKAEMWDELELSVLRKMSKNIVICYRNNRIDLKVYPEI